MAPGPALGPGAGGRDRHRVRRGVGGVRRPREEEHRAGAGLLPHAHLARRAQRRPRPPPRADPDVARRARPPRPHRGLGHPAAVHGVQRLAAAAPLRRVPRRHGGVALGVARYAPATLAVARRPGDRLADRGVVDRRLVLQTGARRHGAQGTACGGAEHPAVRRSLAEAVADRSGDARRATRQGASRKASCCSTGAGAGRGGRRLRGARSSSAGPRRSSPARWSWTGGGRDRSGK